MQKVLSPVLCCAVMMTNVRYTSFVASIGKSPCVSLRECVYPLRKGNAMSIIGLLDWESVT